ncbi:uncharacterized protein LOC131324150 isoform X1 [Rhododendron vialii]|uniref:uncharacterized protein LOC131324150 isoform X1 n=1 Tax=Rhododendron vialii TaxID=182163 RepID=UPI00265F83CC|nr:uncharacterized protein LOC131324150 isoform X1 [Rhododendron vialii]XP_058211972.1 uncharacterized protein LOC131324150 isoform X1 [Rhododendron vialii]XP_058211973.1 uncharacterized protein LOC131324150 isoform X1 [Rhododendron vialii]
MDQVMLPLKVGEVAESRCFQTGFRGAWFRCKIKEICWRKGHIEYALEYFDFPDEKVGCTRIYQVPPAIKMSKEKKRQLMVRPRYPPICHESQLPCAGAISEETVVINGAWKVGDLVDWWNAGAQWSGRVAQILSNDRVQIELPPPPVGEGSCYEVSCNDLRPSLDWSPDYGWSVPTSKEGEDAICARIIKPENQAATGLPKLEIDAMDEGITDVQATRVLSSDASFSSQISSNSLPQTYSKVARERPEENTGLGIGDSTIGKTSSSASVSTSCVRDTSTETAALPAEEAQSFCRGPLMKMRTSENISLNAMYSDTLEASIIDLEELVNKVKWLKGILELGAPLSNAGRPPWKFMEST